MLVCLVQFNMVDTWMARSDGKAHGSVQHRLDTWMVRSDWKAACYNQGIF
jgi:hypothetical protein